MRILRTVDEARAFCEGVRREGKRLAAVPTMGFLHEGHLSLMREGRARADVVVTTLFVNPTQFGPREDLSRYPRDLEGDQRKCASVGVDALFVPETSQMYPEGAQTFVEVTQVSQGLCGASRPGHFRGVATIVTKLLALLRPHVALFGEKDFQQLAVISALNRDLDLGVEIVGMPIVREADGLAMSSRNAYLSPAERARALALFRGLTAAATLAQRGEREPAVLLEAVRAELRRGELREDYVALVDPATLVPLGRLEPGARARLLVAAFCGTTRLIDNLALG